MLIYEESLTLYLLITNTVDLTGIYKCWKNQYHEINCHATPNNLSKSAQQKVCGEKNIDYR